MRESQKGTILPQGLRNLQHVFLLAAIVLALAPRAGIARAASPVPGTSGFPKHTPAASVTSTDPNNPLRRIEQFSLPGGYVTAGVGLRDRGFGTITLAGIPAGSTITRAYLFWDILADAVDSSFAQGVVNGTPIVGYPVDTGTDPCWGNGANFAYESDVTALVPGNGDYALSGFASGITDGSDPWLTNPIAPMIEGASLVVVYANATAPPTQVQIYVGSFETQDYNLASQTLGGFTTPAPVAQALTTFIVADGQNNASKSGGTFNGNSLPSARFDGLDPQAGPAFSYGDLWDTATVDVTSMVSPGDAAATATLEGGPDCLVWVAQVFSVSGGTAIVPGNTIDPVPGRPGQQRTAGHVTVSADSFTPSGNGWTATGTIWLGAYTILDNATLTYDGTSLSGNGAVSLITSADNSRRTVLFHDQFTVNTSSGMLVPQAANAFGLDLNNLGGFGLSQGIYQLQVDTMRGRFLGDFNLNLIIPNNRLIQRVSIILTHTGDLSGSLAGKATFTLGVVTLTVSQATLGTAGFTINQATLVLPPSLGGSTATLAVGNARITPDGQFSLGSGSAHFAFPNLQIGGPNGFSITGASITLTVSGGIYTFSGSGAFVLPGLGQGDGACQVATSFKLASSPPPLREASLSIQGCLKVPIGDTGFFLTGVRGEVQLDASSVAVDVGIDLEGGPDVPGLGPALTASPNAHWDTSWKVGLSGDVTLFKWGKGNAALVLSAKDGLLGTLHLSIAGVVDGDGELHIWQTNGQAHLAGQASVTVQVPKGIIHQCALSVCVDVPGQPIPVAGQQVQFGQFRLPDQSFAYGLKGQARVLTWNPAYFVDVQGQVRFDLGGLQQYQLVDQPPTNAPNGPRQPQTVADATYPITVGATPTLIVALGADSGSLTLSLTDPNGNVITPATTDPAVGCDVTAAQTVCTVANPAPGAWTVTVGNRTGSEHYLLDVLGAPIAPSFQQAPTLAPTTNGYTIVTQASGGSATTYSLYYDGTPGDRAGVPIATQLPLSQTTVTWDTRGVPNGSYSVYAVLDDPASAPVSADSATQVTLSDTTAPDAPTGVQVTVSGTTATVQWTASSAPDIAGYTITATPPDGSAPLTNAVPHGQQTSATLAGLFVSGIWQIAVSAYDTNGNTSGPSVPVGATVTAVPLTTLTLAPTAHGTIAPSVAGPDYVQGTVVNLVATPADGYVFAGWTVDGASAGSAALLPLTMDANHTVAATFVSATPSFADVPAGYWAYTFIEQYYQRGLTTGCGYDSAGHLLYCPERNVTRAEMAVFIDRALGQTAPPPPAQATFADVPPTYWAYAFVEQYYQLGLTTGCGYDSAGHLLFCPDRPVTRAEMAVFIDRALGQTNPPAPPQNSFADVPTNYWAYAFIAQFYQLGLTTGCGYDSGGHLLYCPDRNVTRAEMAVFIIRAFPTPAARAPAPGGVTSSARGKRTLLSPESRRYRVLRVFLNEALAVGQCIASDAQPPRPVPRSG